MSFYKKHIRPRLFEHDSEEIHDRTLNAVKRVGNTPILRGLAKSVFNFSDKRLGQTLFDMHFPNPVGLAAGMDKKCDALAAFEIFGFGFVEGGGITGMEQTGNPKPRLFRVLDDEGLINRMGFNNLGAEKTAYLLSSARKPKVPRGINIGLSKTVPVDDMDAVIADYCYTFRLLYPYADFFVINVSSPNTLGLRALQGREFLKLLLKAIKRLNLQMPRRKHERLKPVLLKIAPDLSFQEIDEIIGVAREVEIDGIVAANTTVKNDGFQTTGSVMEEKGGRSGKPLFPRTVEIVQYIHTQFPSLPIIAVGGICCGKDAYRLILAGASLVQIYTGFVYEGPTLPRRINSELLRLMKRDGIKCMSDWRPEVCRS